MPIYEYQCQACERRLETIQGMSDPPLTTCPECGGDLRKLVSAPAFHFKGSGWYVTDYARKGNGGKDGDKGAEKDAAKPAAAESNGSKDAKKPAASGKSADSAAS